MRTCVYVRVCVCTCEGVRPRACVQARGGPVRARDGTTGDGEVRRVPCGWNGGVAGGTVAPTCGVRLRTRPDTVGHMGTPPRDGGGSEDPPVRGGVGSRSVGGWGRTWSRRAVPRGPAGGHDGGVVRNLQKKCSVMQQNPLLAYLGHTAQSFPRFCQLPLMASLPLQSYFMLHLLYLF